MIEVLNKSRTRRAPCPTRISSNSGPAAWKKGTPASPATARANKVFPVPTEKIHAKSQKLLAKNHGVLVSGSLPGGPTSKTPFGSFPPSAMNLSGFLKNSTTSCNSALASSTCKHSYLSPIL